MGTTTKSILAALAFGLFVAGCATPHMLLVNDQGVTVRCSATGVGLYSAVAANQTFKGCVEDYKRLGYHEMPAQ